tara:strand:- start:7641 stop:7823 length:183 start_codon:yes stop_codon:yes gene_type:complete
MFNFNKKLKIKYLLIFILITLLFYCIFNKFNIIETNDAPNMEPKNSNINDNNDKYMVHFE